MQMEFIKIWKLALAIALIAVGFGCQKTVEEVGGCQFETSLDNYELVWSDEFDGNEIDQLKWSYDTADGCQFGQDLCGWGNNELQYYTTRSENSYIENGNLVIKAQREALGDRPMFGNREYTSARMVTKNKADWTYGRFDIRARCPIGQGLWPAIWMLPTDTVYGIWPKSGEIDIMEYLGHEPHEILGTIHYGNNGWRFDSQYYTKPDSLPSFHDEFHVFSAIWNEQCIQFMVDGKLYGQPNTKSTVLPSAWPFDQDFHMILNIAVGGNLPGDPDATTQFPQTMEVDYVRVYQQRQ
jgi:beta-glucanase (GH16 family)